ncbi:MAG: hypothetical protein PHF84_04435 [bacterium]|nr:hypothetical protein [bacterium]
MIKKLFIVLTILLYGTPVFSAFKDGNNWNARASGIGGSYISIADDASAPSYNPAGIAQARDYQFFFNYSKPYTGVELVNLNYTCLSLLVPVEGAGVFGIGWNDFIASSLYEEYSILLSFGMSMDRIFSSKARNIFAGISVKYLYHGFQLDIRSTDDPVFLSGKGNGNIGIDFGLIARGVISGLPGLNLGIAGKNLNEPDVGLSEKDPVRRQIGLGLSYRIEGNDKNKAEFLPSLDLTYRDETFNLGGGLETVLLNKLLIIRAGANFQEVTLGLGTIYRIRNLFEFNFNYAFLLPLNIEGSYGSHQVSLAIRL